MVSRPDPAPTARLECLSALRESRCERDTPRHADSPPDRWARATRRSTFRLPVAQSGVGSCASTDRVSGSDVEYPHAVRGLVGTRDTGSLGVRVCSCHLHRADARNHRDCTGVVPESGTVRAARQPVCDPAFRAPAVWVGRRLPTASPVRLLAQRDRTRTRSRWRQRLSRPIDPRCRTRRVTSCCTHSWFARHIAHDRAC